MPSDSPSIRRAHYDHDGNIVLPSDAPHIDQPETEFQQDHSQVFSFTSHHDTPHVDEVSINMSDVQWGLPHDPAEDITNLPTVERTRAQSLVTENLNHVRASCVTALRDVEQEALAAAKRIAAESERQVLSGIDDGIRASYGACDELCAILRSFARFVTQPVIVTARKKRVRHYSRGTLFVLDIIRFGGTFAAIFTILFSAMNYESFITIASARIEPILEFTNLDHAAKTQHSLAEKLRQAPSLPTAGDAGDGLASLLPDVGPPNDLLIIPSLNLRAPIVGTPTDSLIREDWKQLETDIQKGLEQGIVHYPGTAEPGQAGNFFLTGHSSYLPWAPGAFKSVFARLGELDVGEEFWVYHGGDKHRYVIDTKKEIIPSDVSVLDQPVGKRIATLMTCTPVGTTLRRLIISAREVDPITGETLEVGAAQHREDRPTVKPDILPI